MACEQEAENAQLACEVFDLAVTVSDQKDQEAADAQLLEDIAFSLKQIAALALALCLLNNSGARSSQSKAISKIKSALSDGREALAQLLKECEDDPSILQAYKEIRAKMDSHSPLVAVEPAE